MIFTCFVYLICTYYIWFVYSLERAAASIGLHVNAHKTEYMCYNQTGDISTLEGTPLYMICTYDLYIICMICIYDLYILFIYNMYDLYIWFLHMAAQKQDDQLERIYDLYI